MGTPASRRKTPAPGCPVVPEKIRSDPDCVSRTAGRVAPADRRGFPLELAPTSPPSVGASPPRKHAHRPPDATSFFLPVWVDGPGFRYRKIITRTFDADVRIARSALPAVGDRIPLENCAHTPAAHLQKHAVESTSFAGQLLLTQQYRAVVDGMGGAQGPTSRFFARVMRIAIEQSFVFVNGVHAANFSFFGGVPTNAVDELEASS